MNHRHPLRHTLAGTALVGALAAGALFASPAAGAAVIEPRAFAVAATVAVGDLARSIAVDDSADRTYSIVDRGSGTPGAVQWMTTSTGEVAAQPIELAGEEPASLAVNPARHELYVLHYRSGELTVVDTATSTVKKVISGVPTYPVGLEVNEESGQVYVLGDGVTTVDPATSAVSAEVAISAEAYPLLKDAVYDSRTKLLWIAEGRVGVITAFNVLTQTWLNDVAIPVTASIYDGEALGGRPSTLALDESLGTLYVGVNPRLQDDWAETKLISIDTATALHIGSPIVLGDTTRELAVDETTHEVYAANGFSNSLSVVDPATWTVGSTVDFSALGITEGTGTANADVWALAVSEANDRVLVSHPYGTARVSIIDRAGDVAPATVREPAPGQDAPAPEEPQNGVWPGPARPALAEAPATAVATSDNSFSWSFSDYAKEWSTTLFGTTGRDADRVLAFSDGTGWADAASGTAQIAWSDGFQFQPYPGLAPEVTMTFGNPVLSVRADGSGAITFDTAWSVAADQTSGGFTRVEVVTFAAGAVAVDGDTVSFVRSPDFVGRAYVDPSGATHASSFPAEYLDYLNPAIRGWFYTSGSALDATKAPNPIAVSYRLAAVQAPAPGDGDEPVATPGTGGGAGGTAPAASDPSDAAQARALARTGADLALPAGLAGLLLAAGALLLLRRRRAA